MINSFAYLLVVPILFLAMAVYFKLANRYNIIDKPNSRSSHTSLTFRGGGIIFPVAILINFIFFGTAYPWFVLGLLLISAISFIDDIKTIGNKPRLLIHLLSVVLAAYQLHFVEFPWYIIILIFVFIIGTINAINFMDGINGITGGYALVTLATLLYINNYEVKNFTQNSLIVNSIFAVLVFGFYNFRNKAKCFAGDVGSVSIAFLLIFLIGQLIFFTGNFAYILLLLVYGLDTVFTILFRTIRKENIFEAHRSHFYQYLANERKIGHLVVAAGYGLSQLLFNGLLVFFLVKSSVAAIVVVLLSALLFVLVRLFLEGTQRLFSPAQNP